MKRLMPGVKLIFLTVSEDPDLAAEAFRAGASGYLLKNSEPAELARLADAVRAMIRVADDNPDDVIDRLRRDREA